MNLFKWIVLDMRLMMHVGHGKTGSSFLQSWLSINSLKLLEHENILYPECCPLRGTFDSRARQGLFSMGNGFVLDPMLDEKCPLRRKRRWMRSLIRQASEQDFQAKKLLFSSEPWTRRLLPSLPGLYRLVNDLEFDGVDLWLLVRDPLDHAVSVYGEMVKRHGYHHSLSDWLKTYDFPQVLLSFLRGIANQSSWMKLRVDHYAKNRCDLTSPLVEWLALLSDFGWASTDSSLLTNRSLTSHELSLIRWLNQYDSAKGKRVAELLVDKLPAQNDKGIKVPSFLKIESSEVQAFVNRWQNIVEEINYFLPGKAALTLAATSKLVTSNLQESKDKFELSLDQLECLYEGLIGRA